MEAQCQPRGTKQNEALFWTFGVRISVFCLSSASWFIEKQWNFVKLSLDFGFPRWLSGKEPAWQCKRCGFDICVGKSPWLTKELDTVLWLNNNTIHELVSQRSEVGEYAFSSVLCVGK